LRQSFLEERAKFQAEMKGTEASNELKMIIQHEIQRKGTKKNQLSIERKIPCFIEIPHIDQYTKSERENSDFDHCNTD